ncbi:MAG: PAS domain S-box protein [Deltaproteobacteria bacterium]|nr:PAS domain S-box protein [Deltaproteobacteria bacterium]
MANPIETIGFKRLVKILGVLLLVLLAVAFILGLLSLKRTQEIVADDFQQQQLILARTTARQIEDGLAFLRRELRIVGYSPAIQYLEEVAWVNRMRVSFEELSRMGVTAIIRVDFDGKRLYSLDAKGERVTGGDISTMPEVIWAKKPENKGMVYQGPITVQPRGFLKAPMMNMAIPIYQESVDESHPRPPGGLDGVLIFQIDLSILVATYCAEIRSGRTGYCWVINSQGIFLYHPEREFIGEDAFTARGRRNPAISFDEINEIQKTRMLTGQEGTALYISGWHRGVIEMMEKYLAFSQAHVGPQCPYARFEPVSMRTHGKPGECTEIWPVAVVAPTAEVAGTISSLYIRQFLIQGVLIFALLCVAVAVIYYERRFTVELEKEVAKATLDLRRSEERYRSVVERSPDFIFLVDHQGRFLAANTAAARTLGSPAAALRGRSVREFFSQEDADQILDHISYVFTTNRNYESKRQTRIRGRTYWLSSHFVPLYGEDGRTVERVMVFARDITDRQRMEEQMVRTEKLASLGTLAAGVAHEINNPVGIMLGFTELLMDRFPPDSKEYEILKTIERQGLNCKRIVENLMTFARQPVKQEEFSELNQNLETVLGLVQNTLLTRKVEVDQRLTGGLPRVRADAGELQQVFLNLITNAVAAMPEGGKLTLTTRLSPDGMVEAIVADTGTGISKEHVDKIFDPFFTTKKVGEGTGLGLSVTYAIIDKCGGSIRFETRTAKDGGGDSGTTFYVSLPAEPQARAAGGLKAAQ